MSTTPNYGLYVTDDVKEKVKELLEKMSNTTDSNMVKIDEALSQKADSSVYVLRTLLASAWSGSNAPYIQTLQVDGLSQSQNGNISIAHNTTFEQREAARDAKLVVIEQRDNELVIAADGVIPDVDIPVIINIIG